MIDIFPAQPGDAKAIALLFEELDQFYSAFYGEPEHQPLSERVDRIQDALFGQPPAARAILAWDGVRLVGLAVYAFQWPALRMTKSLYLKDLYVAQSHRRQGIGKLLMNTLSDIARAHQCSRIEWMADAPNTGAQIFYAEMGATTNTQKIVYRQQLG